MTRSQCLTTSPTISHLEMVTLSVYFKRQNDSKTLPHLSKHVGHCMSAKNCHAKRRKPTQGSVRSCSDDRRVDHRLQKISAVCSMLLWQIGQFSVNLLDLQLEESVLDSLYRRNFWRNKFFTGNKFLWAGVWLWKSQEFLPCENFPLYGIWYMYLQL